VDDCTQNLLSQFLDKLKKKKINKEEILKILEDVLVKEERRHIQDIYISRKNNLIIKVDSSVWGYHFNLLTPKILKHLKEKNIEVNEIKIKIGR